MFEKKIIKSKIRSFKIRSSKGDSEAFEAYRMLIAFVLAVAILTIILSMVNSVNEKSILISTQKLSEGIVSGVKSSGTSARIPYLISDLQLRGQISKRFVENLTGINRDCVSFVIGPSLEMDDSGQFISVKGNSKKMNVYVYCNAGDLDNLNKISNDYPVAFADLYPKISSEECPTFCVFFFNTKPKDSIYE